MRDPGIETDLLPHIGQFVCIERSIDRAFDIYIYISDYIWEKREHRWSSKSHIFTCATPEYTWDQRRVHRLIANSNETHPFPCLFPLIIPKGKRAKGKKKKKGRRKQTIANKFDVAHWVSSKLTAEASIRLSRLCHLELSHLLMWRMRISRDKSEHLDRVKREKSWVEVALSLPLSPSLPVCGWVGGKIGWLNSETSMEMVSYFDKGNTSYVGENLGQWKCSCMFFSNGDSPLINANNIVPLNCEYCGPRKQHTLSAFASGKIFVMLNADVVVMNRQIGARWSYTLHPSYMRFIREDMHEVIDIYNAT